MPRVIKSGDLSQGHCWPKTLPIPNLGLQRQVFVDGLPVIVVGDQYLPHPGGCGPQPPHPVGTILGSPNVFVGGLPVLRDGDPLNCGDVADAQQGTVFCNGGGRGNSSRPDNNQTTGFAVSPMIITYPTLNFRYRMAPTSPLSPNLVFQGCTNEFKPNIYTEITEEGVSQVYLNYPGQPYTLNEGAPNLPSYANQILKDPLPVLEKEILLNGQLLSGDSLGDGIKINLTNLAIYGKPTVAFLPKFLRIRLRNITGFSQIYNFNVTSSEGQCQ